MFFDDARTDATNIIGAPGEGWKIAMALLGFERGVSTLGQQMQFQNELNEIIAIAKRQRRCPRSDPAPAPGRSLERVADHALQLAAHALG